MEPERFPPQPGLGAPEQGCRPVLVSWLGQVRWDHTDGGADHDAVPRCSHDATSLRRLGGFAFTQRPIPSDDLGWMSRIETSSSWGGAMCPRL